MTDSRPAIPIEIRREVLFEARHHCAVCCNPLPLEQAHVVPWNESQEHSVANLIALAVLRRDIKRDYFQASPAAHASQALAPREVILSSFLVPEP
jgi:hypothetical protein